MPVVIKNGFTKDFRTGVQTGVQQVCWHRDPFLSVFPLTERRFKSHLPQIFKDSSQGESFFFTLKVLRSEMIFMAKNRKTISRKPVSISEGSCTCGKAHKHLSMRRDAGYLNIVACIYGETCPFSYGTPGRSCCIPDNR